MLFGKKFKNAGKGAADALNIGGATVVTAALVLGALSMISFPFVIAVGLTGLAAHIGGGKLADRIKKSAKANAAQTKTNGNKYYAVSDSQNAAMLSLRRSNEFSVIARKHVPATSRGIYKRVLSRQPMATNVPKQKK